MADVAEQPIAAAATDSVVQPNANSTSAPLPAPSASLFKRKSHKQAAARKPLSLALKDEEDADDKADPIERALEQTRLLHRFRAKQHSAAVNSNIDSLLSDGADGHLSHSATTTKLTTIGATFQAEEETSDVVEEQMRQYIEEQLDKRRQDTNSARRPRDDSQHDSDSDITAPPSQQSSEASVLNDVVPLLRRKALLDEKEEESAERWLRGIAEVQLPMEHRMNNVERTEAARARITLQQASQASSSLTPQAHNPLPANYNSDFALHKHNWDSAMRQQWKQHTEAMERHREEQRARGIKVEEPKERGRGRGRGGGGGGPDAASDSRVVDRFIKRFKAK